MILRGTVLLSLLSLLAASAFGQQEEMRNFAPGVLTVISPDSLEEEAATGPMPLVEILTDYANLDWKPNYAAKKETLLERAKAVTLRRPVWALEFAFKPVRRIYVDIPQTTGRMQRKYLWYMVYRVKNLGTQLTPVAKTDDFGNITYEVQPGTAPELRFSPHFVFAGKAFIDDQYVEKEYLDRSLPIAAKAIEERESRDPQTGKRVKLYSTIEINKVAIPASDENVDRSVWGYVVWEDVDPRIDFFRIYVQGLTNSYRMADLPAPDGYEKGKPPASGRAFAMKTLQLNFWRAGDSIAEHEEEVHYGIRLEKDPLEQTEIFMHYGIQEPLDHVWVYR
ncbi:MAG: hypothetical protein FJ295_08700 [Planctomycetes bacterium]|nr:hypothetical protein [Planctomycetota bacterium]